MKIKAFIYICIVIICGIADNAVSVLFQNHLALQQMANEDIGFAMYQTYQSMRPLAALLLLLLFILMFKGVFAHDKR